MSRFEYVSSNSLLGIVSPPYDTPSPSPDIRSTGLLNVPPSDPERLIFDALTGTLNHVFVLLVSMPSVWIKKFNGLALSPPTFPSMSA